MPWYVEEKTSKLEDNNYNDLIKMISDKFKILKDDKDKNEIKFSIEMTEDKYKYIKKQKSIKHKNIFNYNICNFAI